MSRAYLIIPGSQRSRVLLRYKKAALKRFKRAGIDMPKICPVKWTRLNCGTAYYRIGGRDQYVCAIPLFLKRYIKGKHPVGQEYLEYYVIHELCHIADKYNGTRTGPHGKSFHKIFSMVCPKKYWRFEQEYKPQFEGLLEEWGLEIPDSALREPLERDIRYIKKGFAVSRT